MSQQSQDHRNITMAAYPSLSQLDCTRSGWKSSKSEAGTFEGFGDEEAKKRRKVAKARTTSGWRTSWRGAPLVELQRGFAGVLRGTMRQHQNFRADPQAY